MWRAPYEAGDRTMTDSSVQGVFLIVAAWALVFMASPIPFGPLIVLGAEILLLGISMMRSNREQWRRQERVAQTPTSPIAHTDDTGLVQITGHISPSEAGLVQAAFSGREAVWVRLTLHELVSRPRWATWRQVFTEVDARPFLVADDSGQVARVLPDGATVVLDRQHIRRNGTLEPPTLGDRMLTFASGATAPHLDAFLEARGIKRTGPLGHKNFRYEEELLAPGDPVIVLGPSRRDPGQPGLGDELVLFHESDRELLLTAKSQQDLVGSLRTGMVKGLALSGLGLGLSLGGLGLLLTRGPGG
jgi:hypothetical protein